jgi:hypothetical protein
MKMLWTEFDAREEGKDCEIHLTYQYAAESDVKYRG